MATAEELLASIGAEEQVLTIDANTREIAIPVTVVNLGVASDDDVKRLYFRMPRQYGEFDLSEFDIRINYMNAGKFGGIYVVDDSTVEAATDTILFSWLVDRHVVEYAGDVQFSVCMKILDNDGVAIKEFNTAAVELKVLEGLEPEQSLVENNPDAFDCVLARLYAVEAATGNGKNGYYSVIDVTRKEDGAAFRIVNQDGETMANVYDGYTPVRGTDYWTIEDEAEIKQDVADCTQQQINTWAPRSTTVTLTVNGWNNNEQTVAVSGVTTDNIVMVAPEPTYTNYNEYSKHSIRCVSQANDSLTFKCVEVPSFDVIVNVVIYYSSDAIENRGVVSVSDDDEGNVTIIAL